MKFQRIAIVAVSTTAIYLMPLASGPLFGGGSFIMSDIAHAKNGNAGGNGGGNGNSGGNSGKSNNSNSNKGGSSAKSGKSNSKSAKSNARTSNKGGFFQKLFKGNTQGKVAQKPESVRDTRKTAKVAVATKPKKKISVKRVSVDPRKIPVPMARPLVREKNFHAKLAGLNSLNRNYKAYMNSNDPRMLAMREFINANIDYENAEAALLTARETLEAANDALSQLTGTLVPYDDFSYLDATPQILSERLETLNDVDATLITMEEAEVLATEIASLSAIIESEEAAAVAASQSAFEAAEETTAALESASGDDALRTALLEAANANRVAEYGEENYVDQEMLDWANTLLGKGDAVGVIDQIRNASQVAEADELEEYVEPEVLTQ